MDSIKEQELIIRGIERFAPLPSKRGIRVVTYNVQCDFWDKEGDVHNWVNCREDVFFKLLLKLLLEVGVDIFLLQEMSWKQAWQIAKFMDEHGFVAKFRAHHTGKGLEDIQETEWTGSIVGIAFRRERFELVEEGRFWLNENPDVQPPPLVDLAKRDRVTPKSFDCPNSYRVDMWMMLTYKLTGEKILFATSQYPMGGKIARTESAKLTIEKLFSIAATQGAKIVFGGDLNLYEDVDGPQAYKVFVARMKDCFYGTVEGHRGHPNTFAGFPGDRFKTPIIPRKKEDGSIGGVLEPRYLDRIFYGGFTNPAWLSFCSPAEYNPETMELYPLMDMIQDLEGRHFTSDHCFVGLELPDIPI
jgi:hypothetical protein